MARPQRGTARSCLTFLLAFPCVLVLLAGLGVMAPVIGLLMCVFLQANVGLSSSNFPAIELYLDYFQNLHPELMERLTAMHAHRRRARTPEFGHPVRFWPARSEPNASKSGPPELTFGLVAGLFIDLELAGFPRQVLYDYLQAEVESKVEVAPEDRKRFRKARNKACNYRVLGWLKHGLDEWTNWTTGYLPAEKVPSETKVIEVRDASLDWLVDASKPLLVPMDRLSCLLLDKLVEECPIWKRVKSAEDLHAASEEADCWQLVDQRVVGQ
jgi:hypothetical protein